MSRKEDEYLIERMGKLLAEIAIIVNGLPPSNISWSYHDLPEKVRALKQAQQPAAAVPAGYVPVSALIEAREEVEDWAAYVPFHFREKHDLAGTLAKMDAQIAAAVQAPPAAAVPPEKPHLDIAEQHALGRAVTDWEVGYSEGWNECRAAMLAAAERGGDA